MKRFLAILLCLIMLFSLIACGEPAEADNTTTTSSKQDSETTDSSDNTTDSSNDTTGSSGDTTGSSDGTSDSSDNGGNTTDSSQTPPSTSTSTSGGGSSTDTPTTPTIVPDRTSYKPTTAGSGKEAVIYYINEVMLHPTLTPYYNGYKTALTMTFDDGYDTNTGTVVSDQFERYGYRGTMMLGPCFINNDTYIDEWNKVLARGYLDVGCHGYDHLEPTNISPSQYEHEIKDAILFLREKFPGQRVLTFATPYAHINDSYEEYLSQFVLGNRLESGGSFVNLGEKLDFNPYRVKAVSVNTRVSLRDVHTSVESCVQYGNWLVELYHCVKDSASGVDMTRSTFEYHCEWLYRNYRDSVWFATFEEVLLYAEELKHTTVTYTACDRESMTFKVTPDGTLDKELYNIPLSLKVYLPQDLVDSAYALVDGKVQPLEYIVEHSTGYEYVIVRDIPATEETEVVIYMGGNKTMKNNCTHRYSVFEVVEPTHDQHGYTLNRCSKCETTYKSAFTNPVHDFSGEETVVIAPDEEQAGLSKFHCTHCDKYEIKEVPYTK